LVKKEFLAIYPTTAPIVGSSSRFNRGITALYRKIGYIYPARKAGILKYILMILSNPSTTIRH